MRRYIKLFLLASLLAVTGLIINHTSVQAATASSGCDDYAIMRCGASGARVMINKINHYDQQSNLKAIYSQYGLNEADYAQFARDNKRGTISKDGSIRVDGQVVGRSVQNLGRVQGDGFSQRVTVNGQTYWGGSFDNTYHADQAEVLVLMKNGKLAFAAIASCGNPQKIVQPPKPQPPKPEQPKPQPKPQPQPKPAPAKPVKHVTKQQTIVVQQVNVEQSKEQPAPQSDAYCSNFATPVLINEEQREYKFTVTANTSNARFVRADYVFSDNADAVMPALPNGNQATINHAFPDSGDYTVTATLHFTDNAGQEITGTCAASVSIAGTAAPTCESDGKGGCDEEELINAGPGTIVAGIFGGAGTLAAAGHYAIRRRLFGL